MQARVIRSDGGLWLGGLRWEEKGELERAIERFSGFRVSCYGIPQGIVYSRFELVNSSLDFNEQSDYEECARISGRVSGGTVDVSEGWTPGEQVEFEGYRSRTGPAGGYIARPVANALQPPPLELGPLMVWGRLPSLSSNELPGLYGPVTTYTVEYNTEPDQPKEELTSNPPAEPKFKPTRGGPISRARFLLMKRRGSW